MRVFGRVVLTSLLGILIFSQHISSAQRILYWRALDVTAHLDANGALQVVERHDMYFSGDWNGGERSFRVGPGQRLTLQSIKRIDPLTGAVVDLVNGNIAAVDHYTFDGKTLRWRSRLPTAPLFDNTERVYQIAYTLTGILVGRDGVYTLDHNFALPDADWPILQLSVDLDHDAVWMFPADFERHRTAVQLMPGSNFTVRAGLRYRGYGTPSAARTVVSPTMHLALFAAVLAAAAAIVVAFVRRESSIGRFEPIPPTDSIDEAWLEARVFSLLPEEAGALWDDAIGASEVAAVLARLAGEQKIETWLEGGELTMRLKQPLEQFTGYEHTLLSALFPDDAMQTSTAKLKWHYMRTGFNPAEKLRPELTLALQARDDVSDRAPATGGWPMLGCGVFGFALAGIAYFSGAVDSVTAIRDLAMLCAAGLLGLWVAFSYSQRMLNFRRGTMAAVWPVALLAARAVLDLNSTITSASWLIAMALLQIAIVDFLVNVAKTSDGPKRLTRRRELIAARRYFAQELQQAKPRIRDSWFPWLVAFGLGPDVDRWFESYGPVATPSRSHSSSFSSDNSHDSMTLESRGGDSFSFGGGRSGGAGASATWAVAASELATGVSAPASSSSSGSGGGSSSGGGGGGGRSGGGGGGGW